MEKDKFQSDQKMLGPDDDGADGRGARGRISNNQLGFAGVVEKTYEK